MRDNRQSLVFIFASSCGYLWKQRLVFKLGSIDISLFKYFTLRRIIYSSRFFGDSVHPRKFALAYHPSPFTLISSKTIRERQIVIAAFAVCRPAFKAIIPKFCRLWYEKTGEIVRIAESYGGSGAQSRAVIDGLPAHVVMLALGADMDRIGEAGYLDKDWPLRYPNHSIVAQSVTVIVVREGNPKGIRGFDDLIRSDLEVVLTNPKSAGVARWNFLSLWGHKVFRGSNETEAKTYVEQVFYNAPFWCKDGRDSSAMFFLQRQGDALITYENEGILASMFGESAPYIVPDMNCLIENPIAVVARNADSDGVRDISDAFVSYCFEEEAQWEFVGVGFRPVHSNS
ncbi:Sulfate-binding protein [Galdieria sulphuraria]|nr:Sulfate-binding protein [Galdieria sulphuraria]